MFYLPEESRWHFIQKNAKQEDIALKIDIALSTIAKTNKSLKAHCLITTVSNVVKNSKINNKIDSLILSGKELYHRLILVVGDGDACLNIINEVAESHKKKPININLELSEKLLQFNNKRRQLKLQSLMADLIKNEKELILLTNTELLFDTSLQQDPLKLLQSVSRNITVIACWDGEVNNTKLVYAVPNHSEYREYSSNDVVFINTEGQTSFERDC